MKVLLSLVFVFYFGSSPAQRLFYTSQDINKADSKRPVKEIHPHWGLGSFASALTVIYKDGEKQKINRDSIWGFEDANHFVYRSYKGVLYQVESLPDIIKYTDANSRYKFRYYSKGLNTPLYGTKRAARADTVAVYP